MRWRFRVWPLTQSIDDFSRREDANDRLKSFLASSENIVYRHVVFRREPCSRLHSLACY